MSKKTKEKFPIARLSFIMGEHGIDVEIENSGEVGQLVSALSLQKDFEEALIGITKYLDMDGLNEHFIQFFHKIEKAIEKSELN